MEEEEELCSGLIMRMGADVIKRRWELTIRNNLDIILLLNLREVVKNLQNSVSQWKPLPTLFYSVTCQFIRQKNLGTESQLPEGNFILLLTDEMLRIIIRHKQIHWVWENIVGSIELNLISIQEFGVRVGTQFELN